MFGSRLGLKRYWRGIFVSVSAACLGLLVYGIQAATFGRGIHSPAKPIPQVAQSYRPAVNKLAEAVGFSMSAAPPSGPTLAIEERASSIDTQDDWGTMLRESKYFERIQRNKSANWRTDSGGVQRSGLTKAEPVARPEMSLGFRGSIFGYGVSRGQPRSGDSDTDGFGNGTYRTMCVRTCDGFYWPISFSTTKENFDKDQASCERSCGGAKQARLFVYRNPGEQIEEMEDLNGKPYKQMTTAFLFRASYNESCKCRAHPWEEASIELHRSYAREQDLQNSSKKRDKSAKAEMRSLKKKSQPDIDRSASRSKADKRAENARPFVR